MYVIITGQFQISPFERPRKENRNHLIMRLCMIVLWNCLASGLTVMFIKRAVTVSFPRSLCDCRTEDILSLSSTPVASLRIILNFKTYLLVEKCHTLNSHSIQNVTQYLSFAHLSK